MIPWGQTDKQTDKGTNEQRNITDKKQRTKEQADQGANGPKERT